MRLSLFIGTDQIGNLYLSNFNLQGVQKKMFISKKGEQLTNEHFFGDTWYTLDLILKRCLRISSIFSICCNTHDVWCALIVDRHINKQSLYVCMYLLHFCSRGKEISKYFPDPPRNSNKRKWILSDYPTLHEVCCWHFHLLSSLQVEGMLFSLWYRPHQMN